MSGKSTFHTQVWKTWKKAKKTALEKPSVNNGPYQAKPKYCLNPVIVTTNTYRVFSWVGIDVKVLFN